MRRRLILTALIAAGTLSTTAAAQTPSYPPLEKYTMARDDEVALARTAAPSDISDSATVKVLTTGGYEVAQKGRNGFVCMVLRAWSAPTYTPVALRNLVYDATVRAPICFDPEAVRTVMPYYELRTRLGMERKTPDQITAAVEAAYAKGELPQRSGVSFGYMWSADQHLGEVGHWHPHMMVFAPYYTKEMFGDSPPEPPVPVVTDDGGTPFAVVVIPLDDRLAIKVTSRQ